MSAEIGEDSADEERGEIAPSPTAEGGAAGAEREQGEGYEKEENPFPLMYHAVPKPQPQNDGPGTPDAERSGGGGSGGGGGGGDSLSDLSSALVKGITQASSSLTDIFMTGQDALVKGITTALSPPSSPQQKTRERPAGSPSVQSPGTRSEAVSAGGGEASVIEESMVSRPHMLSSTITHSPLRESQNMAHAKRARAWPSV